MMKDNVWGFKVAHGIEYIDSEVISNELLYKRYIRAKLIGWGSGVYAYEGEIIKRIKNSKNE